MKSLVKLIGIVALAAVIGFSMIACDNGTTGGGGGDRNGGSSGSSVKSSAVESNSVDGNGNEESDNVDDSGNNKAPVVTVEVKFFQSWNDIHFDVYPDTPLDGLKNRLLVSLLIDGANPKVLSQDEYTLSGELTLGISTIAVTTRDDGYIGTFTVEVIEGSAVGSPVITVESVYAQRSVLYPDTPLDNLKNLLMVKLLYDGANPQMLSRSEYTLYGTLHIGTCNIAVITQGFTFTFTVKISPKP